MMVSMFGLATELVAELAAMAWPSGAMPNMSAVPSVSAVPNLSGVLILRVLLIDRRLAMGKRVSVFMTSSLIYTVDSLVNSSNTA